VSCSHEVRIDIWSNGLGVKQWPGGNNVRTEAEDIVVICYQTTTGEDTADWENLACAVVICKVYKSVRLLELPVDTLMCISDYRRGSDW
jgi:hypothetical protein